MGKIFCFMGKSSSGKDTIFNKVLSDIESLEKIILHTTRPIRKGEVNGIDYYFVSDNEYKVMEENNMIIESRTYDTAHGKWTYFTSSIKIDLENNNYAIINTLEGYNSLKAYFGDDIVVPIYVQVNDDLRLERALNRERKQQVPKYEEMCRRFLADQIDFSEEMLLASNINVRYTNLDLNECLDIIEHDIMNYMIKDKQLRK